jgi:hypothetical protein
MQVLGLGWLAEVVPYLIPLIILSEKWKATVLLTKITRLTTGLPERKYKTSYLPTSREIRSRYFKYAARSCFRNPRATPSSIRIKMIWTICTSYLSVKFIDFHSIRGHP